jgi:CBS domain containing-hemolysin-like protein
MIFSFIDFGVFIAMAFLVGLVGALLPATIAERKGHSGPLFFLFGIFAWPFAMAVAFLIEDKNSGRLSSADRADQIEKWMRLRDQGAISDEQFQSEKAKIMMAP